MVKKFLVWALFVGTGIGLLSAQSNERIDDLLAQAPAHLDSAAYLALTSAALIGEDADLATAYQAASDAGVLAPGAVADQPLTVEALAYLLMKTQKVPGGLEWMVLPSPRAAYRELSFRGVVNTSGGPFRLVSGDEVIRTLVAVQALGGPQK